LEAVVENVRGDIVLAERSGMGDTASVLKNRGVLDLSEKYGFDVVVLDHHSRWYRFSGEHWKRGFLFADVFYESDCVMQTCCLKTHRFGGHFTLSLKNSVGMVARNVNGYDYMRELHTSHNQREMIAEINVAYTPYLVIMDAIKGFSTGGPERGTIIEPELLIAGKDRIAIDAVGVAILRIYGTTPEVSRGRIFEQDQIRRAVELEIGVSEPEEIELIPLNEESELICERIERELKK